MKAAVFLDRDGTIIEEKGYLYRPEEVVVFPGAAQALKTLRKAGFNLFIVTNQSGVGRGYYTAEDMARVNERLVKDLGPAVHFDRIYFAIEAPDQPSRGRKPSPQFLFDARDEFGLDLSRSYMIGDKLIDLECGWNAGVRKSILVRTGYGAEFEGDNASELKAAVIVDGLPEAAEWVLEDVKTLNR